MKLGLSSFSFGWAVGVNGHMPPIGMKFTDLINYTKKEGLSVLQFGDNLPIHALDGEESNKLIQLKNEYQIEIEIGFRKLTEENIDLYIETAKLYGSRIVRFVVDEGSYEPTPDFVISLAKNFEKKLAESHIKLVLENHDRFNAITWKKIMEACNSDFIGICLDTANCFGAGEGTDYTVETLAPFTMNLHIKDYTIQRLPYKMGFTIEGAPAGQGMANIPKTIDLVKKYGKCETAILELWPIPEEKIENTLVKEENWAQESLRYLKPLFN